MKILGVFLFLSFLTLSLQAVSWNTRTPTDDDFHHVASLIREEKKVEDHLSLLMHFMEKNHLALLDPVAVVLVFKETEKTAQTRDELETHLKDLFFSETLSTKDKVKALRTRPSLIVPCDRSYDATPLLIAATYGLGEIYQQMRNFLIAEKAFDEGDHIHKGFYVEEIFQRRKLPEYNETIRQPYYEVMASEEDKKHIHALEVISSQAFADFHELSYNNPYEAAFKEMLKKVQMGSEEEGDEFWKKLKNSTKKVQYSYLMGSLEKLVRKFVEDYDFLHPLTPQGVIASFI